MRLVQSFSVYIQLLSKKTFRVVQKAQNHYPVQPPAPQQEFSGFQRNGSFRGSGRGGRGGGNGGWSRPSATGANDVPLGNPRYSPSEPVGTVPAQLTTPIPIAVAVVPEVTVAVAEVEAVTNTKKKDKKRKSVDTEDAQV